MRGRGFWPAFWFFATFIVVSVDYMFDVASGERQLAGAIFDSIFYGVGIGALVAAFSWGVVRDNPRYRKNDPD